ncbi:MAG: FHA domain-containing protein [Gemmataceae bacterium]
MRREIEEPFDPTRPALIVVYGATRRKYRPLVGEVVVIGRGPCCDIGLISPEVAPVHTLLSRGPDGWIIRDCSGRATRVNGRSVTREPLRNGDVIQIGTFSFEAHLPPEVDAAPAARPRQATSAARPVAGGALTDAEREKLQASRRRMAELALSLRRKLREQVEEAKALGRNQHELDLIERRLRSAHQDQMARQARLVAQEKEQQQRGEELDSFARHLRRQTERLEQDRAALNRTVAHDQFALEAETSQERGALSQERERLTSWQQEIERQKAEVESRMGELQKLFARERESLQREREQIARERNYLDVQRQDLVRERAELQYLMNTLLDAAGVGTPSSRETQVDDHPSANRLEVTQQVIREMAIQRKSSTMTPAVKPGETSHG